MLLHWLRSRWDIARGWYGYGPCAAVPEVRVEGVPTAESARLLELIDAGAKVVRAGTKALEWGYRCAYKRNGSPFSPRVSVEQACGDLQAALERMEEAGDLNRCAIARYRERQLEGAAEGQQAEGKQAWGFSENLEVLPVERKTEAQPAQ